MAVTLTKTKLVEFNPEQIQYRVKVAFDSSYPTGGEEVDMSDKLKVIDTAYVESQGSVGTWYVEVVPTSFSSGKLKLKAFVRTTGAEVGAAVDLSTLNDVYIVVQGSI